MSCTVLEQPQTRVALPGTSVNFTCRGHGRSVLFIDDTIAVNAKSFFNSRGITWVYTPSERCQNVSQYTVTVISSVENSGTKLSCHFELTACSAVTHEAKLIVVNGKPGHH